MGYYYYYKKATTEGQFMYIYTQFTIHRYYITKKKPQIPRNSSTSQVLSLLLNGYEFKFFKSH
jgi:hypothetical protein